MLEQSASNAVSCGASSIPWQVRSAPHRSPAIQTAKKRWKTVTFTLSDCPFKCFLGLTRSWLTHEGLGGAVIFPTAVQQVVRNKRVEFTGSAETHKYVYIDRADRQCMCERALHRHAQMCKTHQRAHAQKARSLLSQTLGRCECCWRHGGWMVWISHPCAQNRNTGTLGLDLAPHVILCLCTDISCVIYLLNSQIGCILYVWDEVDDSGRWRPEGPPHPLCWCVFVFLSVCVPVHVRMYSNLYSV